MITIKNEKVGNIPVLHMSKEELFEKKQPLIFFIHGFMSAKEHNLHYAYLLAEKGFRVILPDVIHHGERESEYSEKELSSRFWKMIVQTIHELNILKEELVSRHLVQADKIGVVGTSMGGIVTNGALAAYDWISAAVSLMGNPAYVRFAEYQVEQMKKILPELDLKEKDVQEQLELLKPYDLSLNPDKLQNRPLMFWHGAKDQVVPYKFAYDLYQHIKSNYDSKPDHLMFILDEKAGHKVSRFGVLQTVAWFDKHLQPTIQKV